MQPGARLPRPHIRPVWALSLSHLASLPACLWPPSLAGRSPSLGRFRDPLTGGPRDVTEPSDPSHLGLQGQDRAACLLAQVLAEGFPWQLDGADPSLAAAFMYWLMESYICYISLDFQQLRSRPKPWNVNLITFSKATPADVEASLSSRTCQSWRLGRRVLTIVDKFKVPQLCKHAPLDDTWPVTCCWVSGTGNGREYILFCEHSVPLRLTAGSKLVHWFAIMDQFKK